ncbi:6-N-hydroxylaminopurine resistance protein [compost metagenome]
MPCWKLSDRFAVTDMALRVQQSGRTGWYYRVLEPGVVKAGDRLQVVERAHGEWSLARECLELPLVASWRRTLERRVEVREVEDWASRLEGKGRY